MMRTVASTLAALTLLVGGTYLLAQAPQEAQSQQAETPQFPEMPPPTEHHQWLDQLEGEWRVTGQVHMDPDADPVAFNATENVRSLGGFWVVGENKGEMMGEQYTGILTLGYDPDQGNYIGTWIGSMDSHLWEYVGSLNEAGDTLSLRTEGPCPLRPGEITQFREVIEIISPDHRTFTSSIQLEDGSWQVMMKADYQRI